MHSTTGSETSIGLPICPPSIVMDFIWNVSKSVYGSNHFPIILRNQKSDFNRKLPRWKFEKADWAKFQILCLKCIRTDAFENEKDPIFLSTCFIKK